MGKHKRTNRKKVQKKNTGTGWIYTLQKVMTATIDYAVTAYLILLVGVMPFYFTQGYGYIATDKAKFFGRVSVDFGKVLLFLLIVHAIMAIAVCHADAREEKSKFEVKDFLNRIKCRISIMDVLVGIYGAGVVLSYLCSDYKDAAQWGAGGWYMGLIPQLILVAIYFAMTYLWKPKKWLFYLMLVASTAVFVLGILNRFGIYPIEMEWRNYGFISTIGNINWYCGYAVIAFFAGVGLFWQGRVEKWWKSLILVPYVFIGFVSLVVQGSLSGIVTIGGMLVILFCFSVKDRKLMQRYWSIVILFALACLFIMQIRLNYPEAITFTDWAVDFLTVGTVPILLTCVSVAAWLAVHFFCKAELLFKIAAGIIATLVSVIALIMVAAIVKNTKNPGSIGALSENPIFTFSPDWGSNRGATWMAGWKCFTEQDFLHKLLGAGPDSMSAYILRDGSEELKTIVKQTFGGTILTNAHNEWLTVLVNLGLLGLLTFIGISIVFIWKCLKVRGQQVIVAACACGLLAYTINNMFSFRQTMNVTMFFILLGLGRAMLGAEHRNDSAKK